MMRSSIRMETHRRCSFISSLKTHRIVLLYLNDTLHSRELLQNGCKDYRHMLPPPGNRDESFFPLRSSYNKIYTLMQFTPIHKLSDKCFGGVYDQHTYIEYCKENVCIIIVLSGKPAIKPPP